MALLSQGGDKFQRVSQLIDWGLNAPVYWLFDKLGGPLISQVDDLELETGRVSIRSLGKAGGGFPTMINLSYDEVVDRLEFLDNNLPVMVSEGIDPEGSIWAGCFMIRDNEFILEAIGPGRSVTVRELTHSKRVPDVTIQGNRFSDRWQLNNQKDLCNVIMQAQTIPVKNFIIEFSVYRYPIGKRKEHLIFWDYEGV